MRSTAVAALLALALPSQALAGGIGLLTTGGLHQTRAYYYDADGNQGIDAQTRLNYGGGLMGVLGDKDDKVQGIMRLWYMQDQREADPDTGDTEGEVFYPAYSEQGPRHLGMFTAGVQWGLLGDPSKAMLTLETHAGSGFATSDASEFLLIEVGPGGTLAVSDELVLFASVTADLRYRKRASLSENVYLGARFMFD
ncbi:hypothetical protein L6R53_30340 [Myxococcota bacterium]|nr:hypothetical protein [Myxococcota bacterium]